MKPTFFLIFTAFFSLNSLSQVISGRLIDQTTKEPIPYVNVGIVGKGIGTVSDFNGYFKIPVADSLNDQILRFSCIGYTALSSSVKNIKDRFTGKNALIELSPTVFSLAQVVVRPKVYKTKILGNENDSKSVSAGFFTNDLGSEIGVIMHIKKAPSFVENINVNLAFNDIGKVKFRLNIYHMRDGEPDSIILKEPILIITEQKTGPISIDMKKYNVSVQDDFLVSLEWIEDYGNDKLNFCAGLMNGNCLYRKTSQDNWHNARPVGIGINSTVTYEKYKK